MNKDNMKKIAFTLAESLITITVIGVVMALMLRSINRVTPDKEKLLFLKSYHAVESIVAETINNPAYYDQTYYTEADRDSMTNLHSDFRDAPLDSAELLINGNTINKTSGLAQTNAVCYFIADKINTIGDVKCTEAGNYSFKASNGVCFKGWKTDATTGITSGKIGPLCDKGAFHDVQVERDGKMTVPASSTAYSYMENQTELN